MKLLYSKACIDIKKYEVAAEIYQQLQEVYPQHPEIIKGLKKIEKECKNSNKQELDSPLFHNDFTPMKTSGKTGGNSMLTIDNRKKQHGRHHSIG